jgi:hypothetical protein
MIGSGSGLDNSPVELIRAGEVSAMFSSASSATEIDSLHFSTSITPLPILLQLNSTAPEPVSIREIDFDAVATIT